MFWLEKEAGGGGEVPREWQRVSRYEQGLGVNGGEEVLVRLVFARQIRA